MGVQFNSKDATRAALGLNGRVVHDRPMRVTRVKPPPPAGKAKAFAKPAVTNRQGDTHKHCTEVNQWSRHHNSCKLASILKV